MHVDQNVLNLTTVLCCKLGIQTISHTSNCFHRKLEYFRPPAHTPGIQGFCFRLPIWCFVFPSLSAISQVSKCQHSGQFCLSLPVLPRPGSAWWDLAWTVISHASSTSLQHRTINLEPSLFFLFTFLPFQLPCLSLQLHFHFISQSFVSYIVNKVLRDSQTCLKGMCYFCW